jgi:hypothetical protein
MGHAQTDPSSAARSVIRRFFVEPLDDLKVAMDAQVMHARRPAQAIALMAGAGIAAWWVYVPVHELLHALGCYVTGGTVRELQIAPEYGAALLARVFPFVVPGGEYAGRLAGFDTHGSDLVYLATDLMPFVLTICIGVPLLKVCGRGQRPALFGAAFVVGLAPFYCLPGDYYEMGSILTTRVVTWLQGDGQLVAFAAFRSDDLVRLATAVWSEPADFQLQSPQAVLAAAAVIGAGFVAGVLLAFATYALGALVARAR